MNRSLARGALLVAALLVAAAPLRGQFAEVGGALPGPLPLFPADNWWNVDITGAPVDPASASFITFIGPDKRLHPDLGGDVDPYPAIYGIPYVVVSGNTPLEQVVFEYDDESDAGAPGRPPGYPIPVQARTEPKWIEGGTAGGGTEGDRHLLLVDRDNRILYELFAARWDAGQQRWEAGSGAIFRLDSNDRRPEGWTSADAAGLAILPGLIRYDEVAGGDEIRHALRVTVRATNGYVYPASHRAGSTGGALPMGARLRLKASVDISAHPPGAQKIFRAMKRYGLIVADNGSDLYVTGTYDRRWDNGSLNPAFRALRASDFEVIQLGWRPTTQPCIAPQITTHPASQRVSHGRSATLTVAASGTPPLAVQWYRGGDSIAGATSLSFPSPPVVEVVSYRARVTNSCGSAESATATLTPGRPRPVRR
jgi:hypothetical protein